MLARFFPVVPLALCLVGGCQQGPQPRPSSPALTHPRFEALPPVPAPPLASHLSPDQLTRACAQAERQVDAQIGQLLAVPDERRTFDNAFAAYEAATTDYFEATGRLSFLKDVHPDAALRRAAAECEERAHRHSVELAARKDVYRALKAALANTHLGELDAQDKRLVEFALRDFRRDGLELPDVDREKLVALRTRIGELETRFATNLDEGKEAIEVTREELEGLPSDYVDRLTKTPQGRFVVTMQYPDYYPLMDFARSEAVRKRAYLVYDNRSAAQNIPLLTEALDLRDQAAKLLGYANHVEYATEPRMAKHAATVADFLDRLGKQLRPGRDRLLAKMTQLKAAETHDPKAALQWWDWGYTLRQLREREYALNEKEVEAYFPADVVLSGMFKVYEQLLQVSIREIPQAEVWAPGVSLYEVHDASDGRLRALFYTDLYPRLGKYGHGATFPLGAGREIPGGFRVPMSALVTNFNPPAHGQPAHFNHRDVVTLFHEFGHVMHDALTTSRYNALSSSAVALDFAEAPSQMLENWVYAPEVLRLITRDPKDPSKTMPEALIQRLVQVRTFDAGITETRQVYYATLDLVLHRQGGKVDPDAVERVVREQVLGKPPEPSTHSLAALSHIMGGYDGGLYGYLWSLVYAADMFTRFEKVGVLDAASGRAYRDIILAEGAAEDPGVLVRRFLGREPNEQAFLRLMNLGPIQ